MSIIKRGNTWWIRISHDGKRIQRSTGTSDRAKAQELHDKIKAELWNAKYLNKNPRRTWIEAVVRWLSEMQHKRSISEDKAYFRWLNQYLGKCYLEDIDKHMIEKIASYKEKTGVKPASVNRMLEVIRAVLRKAENDWEWIEKAPLVKMRKVENKRIRWLTKDEANKLLNELPVHLRDMAAFTLATGLRARNVRLLKWSEIDLFRRHAFIHADEAKGKKAIPVPLNSDAINILKRYLNKNEVYVFTYKNTPVKKCSTRAWKRALKRADIDNFRWHDLRHTWASWHVQNGTSLQELQQLGGWASFEMVLRYAHLSSDHLKEAAERIACTNLVQYTMKVVNNNS